MGKLVYGNFGGRGPDGPPLVEVAKEDPFPTGAEERRAWFERYELAMDKAEDIIKALQGQVVSKEIYEKTQLDNAHITIVQAAFLLESSTQDGMMKKPAYYKAIADIFLTRYIEATKSPKK